MNAWRAGRSSPGLGGGAFACRPTARGGCHTEALQTVDDACRILFLTREDWMASQIDDPPFGAVFAHPRAAATGVA